MKGTTATLNPRLLQRLLLVSCFVASAAIAQARSYTIIPYITTLPAGTYGVNVHAQLPGDTSATPDVDLCVYTGYGSAAPVAASVFYPIAGGAEASFDVLPSTIQEVPPSAFTNGTFSALMYTVPLGTSACTGSAQAATGTAVTLTLEYPAIGSLSLASAPQQNPNLGRRLPAKIEVFGSNFVQTSSSTFNTPSRVVFTSTSTTDGNVDFIAAADLVSTFPSAIPAAATSVAITVCNTAVYSYCSASYALPLNPLRINYGTLTTTPAIASPTQFVKLSATFGIGYPAPPGAPGGQVTFTDNGKPLYSAPLVLDHLDSGFFETVPSTLTTITASLQPVVADFNKDGVPDVLYIEPNAVTHGAKFPVLHLLLGTAPAGQAAGQFAPDLPYYGLKSLPCATVLGYAVADFNLDGYPDLALLCGNPGSAVIYILLNKKNGSFSPAVTSFGPVFGTSLAAADFNHDGKQDLVLAGPLNSAGDTGLQVLLGDGRGGFTVGPISTGLDTATKASSDSFQIAAADLNADGFPDIGIMNGASSAGSVQRSVQLFQNNGTGTFSLAATVPAAGVAFFLAPLRSGQRPDVIVASSAQTSVAINSGTAKIAFSSDLKVTSTYQVTGAAIGDVNGDGLLDLVDVDYGYTRVLTGDGHGLFAAAYPSLAPGSENFDTLLAVVDENGDGYADVVAATTSVNAGVATTTLHSYITSGNATASTPGFRFAPGVHRIVASSPGTPELAPADAQTDVTITGTGTVIALTTSASSPLNYDHYLTLTATVADPTATGSVSFYNGSHLLATRPVTSDGKFAFAHFVPSPASLNAGTYSFIAVYSGDPTHASLTSTPFPFVISPGPAGLALFPNISTIAYGTPLSGDQLDAFVNPGTFPIPTGTFTYTPPFGTVLPIGVHTISVAFISSNPDYLSATATASITVTQAAPVITWPTPADVIVDSILSSTQLNATAATPQGAALHGTFTYAPPSGTKLSVAGSQQLSVLFTPTDTVDYTTATASVSINVGPIGINSIAPAAALLGDSATTVAITGTGFSPSSKVQIAGPSLQAVTIASTYISSTSISAVIPAADLLSVEVLQLSIVDPTKDLPSNAVPFIVTAPSTSVGVNAPTSVSPASQNTVIFHLAAYPAPVTAMVTLTFAPMGTLPDDPGIVFSSGTRTYTITVPAHLAELDLPVTFQSGTIAGALTLDLALEAGGANVTPASIQPFVIQEPVAVPGISSVALVREGDVLTVTTRGFSNTRDITHATFHFTPVPGRTISTPDFTIDVTALFSTWYANPESAQYGSLFTYAEVFNLSSDASVVGQVTVTLTNDVGASQEANTP